MIKRMLFVAIGAAVLAYGVHFFLIPAKIAAGGVSGIATILENLLGIKASITVFCLNIPLLIAAGVVFGKRFLLKSLYGSLLFSLFLEIFSYLPQLGISDMMSCAVAGGFLSGLGLGLVFRFDATTGGTDIVALLLQKARPYFPIGSLMLMADGVVILTSGILFKSFEACIYACIALYISSKMIDSIAVGMDYAKEIMVISPRAECIAADIIEKLKRGVTGIPCVGLYSGKHSTVLFSVVKRNQVVKVKTIIEKHDKNAFVIVSDVKEVIGEGFKE